MEFFNITKFGFRETFKPHMLKNYKEPPYSETPILTCVDGNYDGFAYGSFHRYNRIRDRGLYKPVGPTSMYKRPITCSMDYGFWKDDSALKNQNWYSKLKHLPRKASERTRFYDYALSMNKYYHD